MSITRRVCLSRDAEGRQLKPRHCAERVCEAVYSLELLFVRRAGFVCCFSGTVGCAEPTNSVNAVTASPSWHSIHPTQSTWTANSQNNLEALLVLSTEFFLLLGHLGFWFRHPDKYLNGSKEKQVLKRCFSLVFLFGYCGALFVAALPPLLPRLSPGGTSKPRYRNQCHVSQLLCHFGIHVPRSRWSPSVPDIWDYPRRPDWKRAVPSAYYVLNTQAGLSSLPSHTILQGYTRKKVLERTCEDVPRNHLTCLWAVAWLDRVCMLNPLKNSHSHGKICATRQFLSSDGLCGKRLKCNFCN